MNLSTVVRQPWLIAAAIVATSLSLTTAPTPASGKALGQPSPPNDVAAAAAVLGSAPGLTDRVAAPLGTPTVSLAEATERLFADEDRTNLQAALDAAAPVTSHGPDELSPGEDPGESVGSCHVAGYHFHFTFAGDAKTYFTLNSAATLTIVTR